MLKLTFWFSSPDWFELSKTIFEFAVTEIAWKTIEALQNIGWLNSYGKLIICFWTSIEKKTHLTNAFIEHPQLIIWSKNNSILTDNFAEIHVDVWLLKSTFKYIFGVDNYSGYGMNYEMFLFKKHANGMKNWTNISIWKDWSCKRRNS